MHREPSPTTSNLDEAVAVFVGLRPRLFGIAYRMLGSAVEAEDVVQEVWLRWQKTDRSVVVSPVAFLSSTTTRLAINVAQSARVRRETYIGPWLPEPIDTSSDPEVGAERAEALELALLLVLEKLSPTERAAYVLREAFDYSYPEIAEILQLSPVNGNCLGLSAGCGSGSRSWSGRSHPTRTTPPSLRPVTGCARSPRRSRCGSAPGASRAGPRATRAAGWSRPRPAPSAPPPGSGRPEARDRPGQRLRLPGSRRPRGAGLDLVGAVPRARGRHGRLPRGQATGGPPTSSAWNYRVRDRSSTCSTAWTAPRQTAGPSGSDPRARGSCPLTGKHAHRRTAGAVAARRIRAVGAPALM